MFIYPFVICQVCQRGKLLLAQYLNDSASVGPNTITMHYYQVRYFVFLKVLSNVSSSGHETGGEGGC